MEEDEDPDEDEDERIASRILKKTDYMCTLMKAALLAVKPDNSGPGPNEDVLAEAKRQKDVIKFLKVTQTYIYKNIYFYIVFSAELFVLL